MEPLIVTAHLASPFVTFDDWFPALDAILQRQVLDERGLLTATPNAETIAHNDPVLTEQTPLKRVIIEAWQVWAASAPHYLYRAESTNYYNKRWSAQDTAINWGGKKPTWNSAAGNFKSWRKPAFARVTDRVCWYVVGDRAEIDRLLFGVPNLGKLFSKGFGIVSRWSVRPDESDRSLQHAGKLAKILPLEAAQALGISIDGCLVAERTYSPPYWLQSAATTCVLPVGCVEDLRATG